MRKNALVIMTKLPIAHFSKTRLIPHLGAGRAKDVHLSMLYDLERISSIHQYDRVVFFAPSKNKEDDAKALAELKGIFIRDTFYEQKGKDLFENMEIAAQTMIGAGYEKVLIIGSDVPEFFSTDFTDALKALDNSDFVFAPSKDGGYSLIGLKDNAHIVFNFKPDSPAQVLNASIYAIEQRQMSYALLRTINDIDELSDIETFLMAAEQNKELRSRHVYQLLKDG